MSSVSDRCNFYRQHGLDTAQEQVWGPLTPELIEALSRLHDLILVSEVMEGPRIRVRFEVPTELDEDFQAALKVPPGVST